MNSDHDRGGGDDKLTGDISSMNLLVLSVTSAVVYLLLSLAIFYFIHGYAPEKAFYHGYSIPVQLLAGIVAGCIAAALIGFAMSFTLISDVLHDFYIVKVLMEMRLTYFDRTQLSLFAGVGEELLFRGAIQPLLGIWLTSILFIGMHGYFKFKKTGHLLFGMIMFTLSVGLGYIFEIAGLVAAMAAHAVYDAIMLKLVQDG